MPSKSRKQKTPRSMELFLVHLAAKVTPVCSSRSRNSSRDTANATSSCSYRRSFLQNWLVSSKSEPGYRSLARVCQSTGATSTRSRCSQPMKPSPCWVRHTSHRVQRNATLWTSIATKEAHGPTTGSATKREKRRNRPGRPLKVRKRRHPWQLSLHMRNNNDKY